MRKFYYSACAYSAPHIGVVLDDVIASLEKGDDVYWAYCHNVLSKCWVNMDGEKSRCALCHRMYKEYYKNYANTVHLLPIKYNSIEHQERGIILNTVDDFKNFVYRGVRVGLSILSTYFTATRDLDLKNREWFDIFSKPLIGEICDAVDYCYDAIERIRPDEVIVFNGRHFSNRFIVDICKNAGVKLKTLEVLGNFTDPPIEKIYFKDGTPLDIKLNGEIINFLWQNSKDSYEEKKEKAASFYHKRRKGVLVADVKVYVAKQEKGLLPKEFDEKERNIAIFNSSPDEYASIGGEWEDNLLFASQYETIQFMLENSPKDMHYYLRIHPNLEGIDHKAHMELYKLASYDNITIIKPSEKISTYALLDACEKTFTFGSTMGVEASYWGKPSVMSGHSLYETLDVCYIPKSKEELLKLILEKDLKPKSQEGCLKYAYFLLDRKYLAEPLHLDIQIQKKNFIVPINWSPYLKILNSKTLYYISFLLYIVIIPKLKKLFIR